MKPAALTTLILTLTANSAWAEPAQTADEAQLDTVVVTGELITREERRTTTSVAVKSGGQIEQSTARDVYDVIRDTPNVSVNPGMFGLGTMTMRGISSYGGNTSNGAYTYSSATSIVLDGVGLPRAAQAYGDLSAFDLDSVEIFRGPQSTSQGRNAMAGAVIIRSQSPELADESGLDSLSLRGRISGGSASAYQGAAAVDFTPKAKVLGFRLMTDHRGWQGDIPNVTRNERDWSQDSSHGYGLRSAWQPGGEQGRYHSLFTVRDLDRSIGSRYVEQIHERERVATSNEPDSSRVKVKLGSWEQSFRLNASWSFSSVSAVVNAHTLTLVDLDQNAGQDGTTHFDQLGSGFSQELRVQYQWQQIRGTLGAYYYDGRDHDTNHSVIDANALLRITGFCNPAALCSAPIGNFLFLYELDTHITDTALFGEADWQVLDRLTLTVGLRLDKEQNHRDYINAGDGESLTTQVALAALRAGGAYPSDGTTTVNRDFSTVLPKFAAVYEVIDGWFAGAAYAEGYRPGGGGYNPASQRRFEFDSEYTQNYELSLKGGWEPWRLETALHLFHTDYRDMQVPTGSGVDQYVENAGQAKIEGGELELRFRPFAQLRVIGGLGLTDGHFIDYRSTTGDFSGNPLPQAPERSVSFALEWMPLPGLFIRPELRHAGDTPSQPDNAPAHQLPEHTLLGLALRWQQGAISWYFNGENLTDQHYRTDAASYGLSLTKIAALGPERRLSAGLEFEF